MRFVSRAGVLAAAMWLAAAGRADAAKASARVVHGDRAVSVALWYPEHVPVIRGVLAITGGQAIGDRSGDTRSLVESQFYQRVAESWGFALLGSEFEGSYTDASDGPGQALLDALATLAHDTGRPELARAPLLLHGFSNGGYFSLTFARWKPGRVIAFCVNKSGFAKVPFDPALLAVPALFVYGEKELAQGLPSVIRGLVRAGRERGALWAEVREPGKGHEEGEVERIVLPFFGEMVAARYPEDATPLPAEVPLIALDASQGWLADPLESSIASDLPSIAPARGYPGDPSQASWLPSEGVAKLWRGFVAERPVLLSAPASNATLAAARRHSLAVTGIEPGQRVVFYDGARPLAAAARARGGRAHARFRAERAGVLGIVAEVHAAGEVVRTSRPTAVVVHRGPRRRD